MARRCSEPAAGAAPRHAARLALNNRSPASVDPTLRSSSATLLSSVRLFPGPRKARAPWSCNSRRQRCTSAGCTSNARATCERLCPAFTRLTAAYLNSFREFSSTVHLPVFPFPWILEVNWLSQKMGSTPAGFSFDRGAESQELRKRRKRRIKGLRHVYRGMGRLSNPGRWRISFWGRG
jgi:hypothetical protein